MQAGEQSGHWNTDVNAPTRPVAEFLCVLCESNSGLLPLQQQLQTWAGRLAPGEVLRSHSVAACHRCLPIVHYPSCVGGRLPTARRVPLGILSGDE